MKYTTKFVLSIIFVTGLFWGVITVYAVDRQPGPGIPTQPVPELPKVKPPEIPAKPDLSINTSGGGLGGLPDLYPDNPGMGPSQFWFSGWVLNGGRAAVNRRFEVAVFLSTDRKVSPDDRLIDTIVILGVQPAEPGRYGAFVIPKRYYSIIGIPVGTYYICARVDPHNRIIETDEKNNDECDHGAIRIHPAVAK